MSDVLKVDLDLVKKYNVPGPRYTSYPPATHFTEDVKRGQIVDKIKANNESSNDLSLYFHLPFCESLCWFCGCTTVITTQHGKSEIYLNYLKKEMDLMGRYLNPDRVVEQIHLGGGTPTFFQPDEIRDLGEMVRSRYKVSDKVEAGVEIDPRRCDREKLVALREAGFNRSSIGVQDNNPEVQKAVHRIQPYEMTRQVVDWIREVGFESLNIDLIYGLPFQSVDSFEQTLEETLNLEPDRLAVFSYAHVPWMKPAQKIFKEDGLPDAELKLRLLKLIVEKLTSSGYAYVGMDHFALEEDDLTVAQKEKSLQRNFQGYSTTGGVDIYSFGMSSISQADDIYWQNEKELPNYYSELDANQLPIKRGYLLTEEDEIRRKVIMRLMCDFEINYRKMSDFLSLNFEEHFAAELNSLADLESDGLINKTPQGIEITGVGRLLIRAIAMRFDPYLLAKQSEGKYSKVI